MAKVKDTVLNFSKWLIWLAWGEPLSQTYNQPHQYLQELFEYFYDGLLVIMDSPASLLGVILTLCDLKEYLL